MKENIRNGLFGLFSVLVMGYLIVIQAQEKKESEARVKVMNIAKGVYSSK
jgi:hypothetical protein